MSKVEIAVVVDRFNVHAGDGLDQTRRGCTGNKNVMAEGYEGGTQSFRGRDSIIMTTEYAAQDR